ncbi:MAG: hypothetical protein Q4Q53_02350 [Methanocorpusculum sp.]|nr:hypothetical protein [Methanocorpusculum sp.]
MAQNLFPFAFVKMILMKKIIISLLAMLVVCLCVVPASATSSDDVSNNANKITFKVSPWVGFTGNEDVQTQYGNVVQNENDDFELQVTSAVSDIKFSLEWQLAPIYNQLRLSIMAPNGQILGTFGDSYDGVIDGKIPVEVQLSAPSPGEWTIRVIGYSVSISQNYALYVLET